MATSGRWSASRRRLPRRRPPLSVARSRAPRRALRSPEALRLGPLRCGPDPGGGLRLRVPRRWGLALACPPSYSQTA
ncbi:hypothetical protein ACFPRL_14170 [Pseudoclavibacter helvolus]